MAADVTDQVVEKNSAAETIRSSVGWNYRHFEWSWIGGFCESSRQSRNCGTYLFCKSLKENVTGRAVFEVINDFFNEQKIKFIFLGSLIIVYQLHMLYSLGWQNEMVRTWCSAVHSWQD
jgi:hypothetical protein